MLGGFTDVGSPNRLLLERPKQHLVGINFSLMWPWLIVSSPHDLSFKHKWFTNHHRSLWSQEDGVRDIFFEVGRRRPFLRTDDSCRNRDRYVSMNYKHSKLGHGSKSKPSCIRQDVCSTSKVDLALLMQMSNKDMQQAPSPRYMNSRPVITQFGDFPLYPNWQCCRISSVVHS